MGEVNIHIEELVLDPAAGLAADAELQGGLAGQLDAGARSAVGDAIETAVRDRLLPAQRSAVRRSARPSASAQR